jgi:hypothetical protein
MCITRMSNVTALETPSRIVCVPMVVPGTAEVAEDHGMVICDPADRARHVDTVRQVLPACIKKEG